MAGRKQRGDKKKVGSRRVPAPPKQHRSRRSFAFISRNGLHSKCVCCEAKRLLHQTVLLLNNHHCVPSIGYLLLLGIGIQNYHQGDENRLKGGKKKYWGPEVLEESSPGHHSSVTSENMGQKNIKQIKWTKERRGTWSTHPPFTPNYQTSYLWILAAECKYSNLQKQRN